MRVDSQICQLLFQIQFQLLQTCDGHDQIEIGDLSVQLDDSLGKDNVCAPLRLPRANQPLFAPLLNLQTPNRFFGSSVEP